MAAKASSTKPPPAIASSFDAPAVVGPSVNKKMTIPISSDNEEVFAVEEIAIKNMMKDDCMQTDIPFFFQTQKPHSRRIRSHRHQMRPPTTARELMTGRKPARRSKKMPRNDEKQLDNLFCELSLPDIKTTTQTQSPTAISSRSWRHHCAKGNIYGESPLHSSPISL